jgi:hypothetical protein
MMRGVTLASVEVVRGFADSLSSFADNVIRRNESRDGDGRSVRDMATRLPEDIATSMADTVDRFVDIPRRAADRYSRTRTAMIVTAMIVTAMIVLAERPIAIPRHVAIP